jgi:hypothetical protein
MQKAVAAAAGGVDIGHCQGTSRAAGGSTAAASASAAEPMEVVDGMEGLPAAAGGAAAATTAAGAASAAAGGVNGGWFGRMQPAAVHAAVHEVMREMEATAAAAR